MSYIGVPKNSQETFGNLVHESQKNFSDYSVPYNSETYWATVDYYWPQIKNIVLMFTFHESDELDKMVKERDSSITTVFNDAWFNAPDYGRIHLIPAWHIFCDLCSESILLHQSKN